MDLSRIANQNPWWNDRSAIEKDEKVKTVLDTKGRIDVQLKEENQVLVGPRQLGKTTALKYDIYKKITKEHTDPKHLMYYSFDTSRNFEDISEVMSAFVNATSGKSFLYLDEVSFVDGWQRAVKSFLDSKESSNSILYITGSSSINLKKELMPGRDIKFIEFMPLSFREFLISFGSESLKQFLGKNKATDLKSAIELAERSMAYFEEIGSLFKIYLNTGGYPDAIFDYMTNGYVRDSIYDIHWNAFVSDISKAGKSIEIATAVVYGLVESYSSKVNLSRIAQMQGIKSHVTVREYLEMLDDLFTIKSIFPIAEKKYVFRKDRKVYFDDPFLYNLFAKKLNIIGKNAESKKVEGVIFNSLYRFANKGKQISEPKVKVGFYSGKKEVDFVVNGFGFEAKWQNDVSHRDFPNIDIRNKILLSKGTFKIDNDVDKAKILPASLFLATL
ncbi:AAA+ superfamily ATPase [Candidatus Mancarchaeum acidiphilum]|uniref:AAA+ superfamily ATPase n=1 Tax=Candidatus Mancarchaeum acidiphilum TaxID=1920749 RepID=A0A218NN57_9ARCH|nr:ATP-binding protein [Candidatus Mancarchaeum acidiphilum]ASI13892.1 AAA+ superfamily ATPase [Candidatus Mancarchaeum acidiphilum]